MINNIKLHVWLKRFPSYVLFDLCIFLQLGIIGIAVVAVLTDHYCHLIVKTKHHAIDKVLLNKVSERRSKHRRYETLDNKQPEVVIESRNIDFETIQTKDTTPLIHNDSNAIHTRKDNDVQENDANSTSEKEYMLKHMTYGDVGKLTFGRLGVGMVNFSIGLTQFGFGVGYFILIGNTIHSFFPDHLSNTTNEAGNFSTQEHNYNIFFATTREYSRKNDNMPAVYKDLESTLETTTANVIPTFLPNTTSSELIGSIVSDAQDLRILVAAPLPVFIVLVLIRSVRYLGIISAIANTSMLIGILAVIGFLLSGNSRTVSQSIFYGLKNSDFFWHSHQYTFG